MHLIVFIDADLESCKLCCVGKSACWYMQMSTLGTNSSATVEARCRVKLSLETT